jgi:ketosteroid isomerase-like protein
MTSIQNPTVTDISTAERLSEALAEVFRTAEMGDVLTDDVFLDGNPPLWRFQLQGIEAFEERYKSYAPNGMDEVTVVRTVPTATGFVAELTERVRDDGKEITGREIVLCTVRDGRISELTVYCTGDWDEELRARHAAEAPMLRP